MKCDHLECEAAAVVVIDVQPIRGTGNRTIVNRTKACPEHAEHAAGQIARLQLLITGHVEPENEGDRKALDAVDAYERRLQEQARANLIVAAQPEPGRLQ